MATQIEWFSLTCPQKLKYLKIMMNLKMEVPTMARTEIIVWSLFLGVAFFNVVGAYGMKNLHHQHESHHDAVRKLQAFKASLTRLDSVPSTPSSSSSPSQGRDNPRVYRVTTYGADPTGNSDSTNALLAAIADAAKGPSVGQLIQGVSDLGGAEVDLEGGTYVINQPLRFPTAGVGNIMIHGGSIRAGNTFNGDRYLIDLSSNNGSSGGKNTYNYEYITLKDLLLDSSYRGGGIQVINSLRTNIDNCYITHFTLSGIFVQSGHETYIRNTFIGQHITAGGDPAEKSFGGTGITLQGNDNAVTDVVIFSASIGILIAGQANSISGVHCYNKATGFGGTGIYIQLPGKTQTRIVNSYMDYTSIVAEDPVQLHISSSFFLGDGNIVLKSIKGIVNGVSIVDNLFSGSNSGVEIVHLDQSNAPFNQIDQVYVDRNIVSGMNLKSTVAKKSAQGNGTSWTIDFNNVLLFPNLIKNVHYSLSSTGETFPNHGLKSVSNNQVVVGTSEAVNANVFVTVDQTSN